jgi:alcohol dehydrogenase (cytochrome c)
MVFPVHPHDLYDFGAVQTEVLVDTTFKGQPRKLVITANRNGFLYILDRTNGKYLYSKQFIKIMNWASGIDANGRPISNNLIPNEKGVTVCPSVGGGTNWYSPSYDPATNTFYFRSLEACDSVEAKPEDFAEGRTYYATGQSRPEGDAPSPNAAYINAFDLNKMDFTWRDQLIGQEHANAGVMTTAGGLIAFGNDSQEFEIGDVRTGKLLWSFNLGQPMHASPMSYGINGKQYFAVAAGDNVVAFALP